MTARTAYAATIIVPARQKKKSLFTATEKTLRLAASSGHRCFLSGLQTIFQKVRDLRPHFRLVAYEEMATGGEAEELAVRNLRRVGYVGSEDLETILLEKIAELRSEGGR